MAWQTPKTNWVAANGVTEVDLDRIEGNTAILATYGNGYGTTAGTSLVYTLTVNPPLIALVDAAVISFKIHLNNASGTVTLNVNGLGAKNLVMTNGVAPPAGALKANSIYTARYSSTLGAGSWVLQGGEGGADQAQANLNTHIADTTDVHGATSANVANKLVQRDSAGRFKASNPSATDDVAIKGYVDDAVGTGTTGMAKVNVDNHFSAFETFENGLAGINTGVSGYNWSTMSSGGGGDALFGQNCYIDPDTSEYKYRNTHATLGARGIVFRWSNSDYRVQPWFFDMGAVSTTAGTAFTPTLNKMWVQGQRLDADTGIHVDGGDFSEGSISSDVNWGLYLRGKTGSAFGEVVISSADQGTKLIIGSNVFKLNDSNVRIDATPILSFANLDNYTTEGEFFCGLNSVTQTLLNCPTGSAFHLKVTKHAGFNQELTEYPNTATFRKFTRNAYGGAWGPWREVLVTMNDGGGIGGIWVLDRGLWIHNGKDLTLQAASGSDSGDVVFRDGSSNEIGRVWSTNGEIWARGGPSGGGAIWTKEKLRVSGGALQFYDGGTWKGAGGVKNVQRGIAALSSSSNTINVAISAVNMSKTMININSIPETSAGNNFLDAQLTSSTNLYIHAPTNSDIYWEVVEFY